MLDVLNDPDRAALVGWIFTAAISTTLPIIGLIPTTQESDDDMLDAVAASDVERTDD